MVFPDHTYLPFFYFNACFFQTCDAQHITMGSHTFHAAAIIGRDVAEQEVLELKQLHEKYKNQSSNDVIMEEKHGTLSSYNVKRQVTSAPIKRCCSTDLCNTNSILTSGKYITVHSRLGLFLCIADSICAAQTLSVLCRTPSVKNTLTCHLIKREKRWEKLVSEGSIATTGQLLNKA